MGTHQADEMDKWIELGVVSFFALLLIGAVVWGVMFL